MKVSSIFGAAVLALGSLSAYADNGDSSSIDARTVTAAVQSSTGVMMRVPVDESGRELTSAAELRVVSAKDSDTSSANLANLWGSALDVSKVPQKDSSTDSGDSSTSWGWNRWNHGGGWNSNYYYYNNYRPTYYYRGYTYNYGNPYYYNYYQPNYYNGYNTWGYRYYYYGRRW